MIIYRLEYADTRAGMYHYSENDPVHDLREITKKFEVRGHMFMTYRPMPQDDKKLMKAAEEKFPFVPADAVFNMSDYGFSSPQQLLHWFFDPRLLEALESTKLVVAQYNVPDDLCLVGDTQVLFEPAQHKLENLVQSQSVKDFVTEHTQDLRTIDSIPEIANYLHNH